MKKKISIFLVFVTLCTFFLASCNTQNNKNGNIKEIKIGVSVYDEYDTFIKGLVSNLIELAKKKENQWGIHISIEIKNAGNSQIAQNDQMDDFIEKGYDLACINLVDRTDASTIVEKAKNAKMPVIFFNRELVKEDLNRWDQLYYVGADAPASGKLQGRILLDILKKKNIEIDKNQDGLLQYILLEGEPGHNDSLVRSISVIREITNGGYQVKCLQDEIANWNRDQAANKMEQYINQYGKNIEVVIANNDDMALGAIDALEAARIYPGSKDYPVILGIDGTDVGLEAVKNGKMQGTVLNDSKGQADAMLELAKSIVTGKPLEGQYKLIDNKYIRLPYKIVTKANLDKIQTELMNK